jgi:23S rRNA (cytosine1962-C5)-methyltransferase
LSEELNHLILFLKQQYDSSDQPRRLLHGRGGCFKEFNYLNIDVFDDLIVVMLHESRSQEWGEQLAEEIIGERIKGVIVQDRSVRPSKQICYGQVPEQKEIHGEGVIYALNPMQIKNPGWFLDMRVGREWVSKHAKDKKVLNLFAYTCGFSLAALKHGAALVINMDMNSSVLNRGKKNHILNSLDLQKSRFFDHNVLKSFGKIKKYAPYDMVIIDPPSIQAGSFQLRRDYPKLISRLAQWLDSGGMALLCCNDPLLDAEEFEKWICDHLSIQYQLKRLPQPQDFPEKNLSRALKVYELRVT